MSLVDLALASALDDDVSRLNSLVVLVVVLVVVVVVHKFYVALAVFGGLKLATLAYSYCKPGERQVWGSWPPNSPQTPLNSPRIHHAQLGCTERHTTARAESTHGEKTEKTSVRGEMERLRTGPEMGAHVEIEITVHDPAGHCGPATAAA